MCAQELHERFGTGDFRPKVYIGYDDRIDTHFFNMSKGLELWIGKLRT
jgi:hypothetical protein